MAKHFRGKLMKAEYGAAWRGTCPHCGKTGVKLLWDMQANDKKIKVCKICNIKKSLFFKINNRVF